MSDEPQYIMDEATPFTEQDFLNTIHYIGNLRKSIDAHVVTPAMLGEHLRNMPLPSPLTEYRWNADARYATEESDERIRKEVEKLNE